MMVTHLNPPNCEQHNELISLRVPVWWRLLLERWVIDFSPGSNQNVETLIKVRKVVSLLPGLDDRCGDTLRHTKRVLVTTRTCTVAKVTLDVSLNYFEMDAMDEMSGPKGIQTNGLKPHQDLMSPVGVQAHHTWTQRTIVYQVIHSIRHSGGGGGGGWITISEMTFIEILRVIL